MRGEQTSGAAEVTVEPVEADYGWWESPWPASLVASGKVSRGGLQSDGDAFFWSESRPDDGGRQVVVQARSGEPPTDVSPAAVSVRSRVHEYGGGAATVAAGVLFYVDQADQRWYRGEVESASAAPLAVPLTAESPADGPALRYADGRLTRSGRWLVSIEERVAPTAADTRHRLVGVAVDGSLAVVPLVEGRDFVAAPRPSPDGQWLAWVAWDRPSMPWDSSEVWVARLDDDDGPAPVLSGPRLVAGGAGVSVGQPRWCRDGSLLFVDDHRGWWLPHRLAAGAVAGGGRPVALVDRQCEFHAPDWVVGQSTMAELADGSIVCRMHEDGRDRLVRLRPPDRPEPATDASATDSWSLEVVDQPCVSIAGVAVAGPVDRVCVLGSTATEAQGVFEISVSGATASRRVSATPGTAVSPGEVAEAVPHSTPTVVGPVPGLFFPPTNTRFRGPDGSRPPLVVFCHGGPTAAAEPGFDPVVQFFTSRGLAVAVVDYRGSSGYGRAYRRALDGLWGEADIDDCARFADSLAEAGWVDGTRMAIRGTSAGGLTALGALIRWRRFAGAAAWYGVTDLEGLAADTHAFESRYVDSLVGPWPEAAARYRSRSPIHHADRVVGQVLLLQGADDPVVPVAQARGFAQRLDEHHVRCQLTVFPGESHGFRRAETIEASLTAELDFYRSLFATPGTEDDPR
jgi:dipeptidyl aminopeptidase/acylaminoacyl peptidase